MVEQLSQPLKKALAKKLAESLSTPLLRATPRQVYGAGFRPAITVAAGMPAYRAGHRQSP